MLFFNLFLCLISLFGYEADISGNIQNHHIIGIYVMFHYVKKTIFM